MPSLLDTALLRLDPERVPLDGEDFEVVGQLAVLDRFVDRVQHRWSCTVCGAHGRLRGGSLICEVCGDGAATFVSAA